MRFIHKKTVNAIVESGNHYVLQLKRNQHQLFDYAVDYVAKNSCKDSYQTSQKAHGRQTQWFLKVYPLQDEPLREKHWTRLNCLIVVEKQWYQKEKNTRKTDREMLCFNSVAYYISDLVLSAQVFAEGIRGHWGIENRLHWVKDVILKEDNNRIIHQNGAVNMAIFNNIAINFLRQNFDDSVKYSQILFGQNVKELFPKIRT